MSSMVALRATSMYQDNMIQDGLMTTSVMDTQGTARSWMQRTINGYSGEAVLRNDLSNIYMKNHPVSAEFGHHQAVVGEVMNRSISMAQNIAGATGIVGGISRGALGGFEQDGGATGAAGRKIADKLNGMFEGKGNMTDSPIG